jgi:hypothetical protein
VILAPTLLALAALQAGPPSDWRASVTQPDRVRLRGWRDAWLRGLEQARVGGHGAQLARDPTLFDPDRALPRPLPPPGRYRCRTVKLGTAGATGPAYVAYPAFACRIVREEGALRFEKLGGSQRASGQIYRHDSARGVFLGTLALGDERRAMPYGRDRMRDMAGHVERIGERRWRLVLPAPAFESLLDVIELTPA